MAKRFTNGIKRKKFSAIAEIKKLDNKQVSNLLELRSLLSDLQRQSLNESMSLDDAFILCQELQSQGFEQFCNSPMISVPFPDFGGIAS